MTSIEPLQPDFESEHQHRTAIVARAVALLAALLALSGVLAARAEAVQQVTLASGVTPMTYAISGGATGSAVTKCTNPAWSLQTGTSWIGVSPDCTVGDAATNMTTDYTATFTLPANATDVFFTITLLADNAGSVFVNGTQISTADAGYTTPVTSTSTTAAHGGLNTLDIRVVDTGGPNGADFNAAVNFTSADLALTKTASPSPTVLHGQPVTYTLMTTNNGPDAATAPTITDTLPAGQTFVAGSSSPGCSAVLQIVTCTTADLPSMTSSTVTIVATAGTVGTGQTNTATVSSTTGDPNLANNTATATVNVVAAADLSLTKSGSPNPVIAGQQLTYTISATNAGPDTAVNAKIVDVLPPGETLLNEGTPPAGSPVCTAVGSTVTCLLGDIPAGQHRTARIVVSVAQPPPSTVTNSATVSSDTADPNLANNTATTTTTVKTSCTTTITGTHVGAIDVPAGTFLCLSGANQTGAILVDAGGALTVTNSTVTGGIQSNGAVFMTLCGSTVNGAGSVVIKNTTLLVRVGDDVSACAGNRLTGSLTVSGNKGGVEVFGNTINGSTSVDGNLGASAFSDAIPEVERNTIGGALGCSGNAPTTTNDGAPNTVTGAKLGQCAKL